MVTIVAKSLSWVASTRVELISRGAAPRSAHVEHQLGLQVVDQLAELTLDLRRDEAERLSTDHFASSVRHLVEPWTPLFCHKHALHHSAVISVKTAAEHTPDVPCNCLRGTSWRRGTRPPPIPYSFPWLGSRPFDNQLCLASKPPQVALWRTSQALFPLFEKTSERAPSSGQSSSTQNAHPLGISEHIDWHCFFASCLAASRCTGCTATCYVARVFAFSSATTWLSWARRASTVLGPSFFFEGGDAPSTAVRTRRLARAAC